MTKMYMSDLIKMSHVLTVTMGKCNHEEADTRIIVHVNDMLHHGGRIVMIGIVDTCYGNYHRAAPQYTEYTAIS